MTTTPEKQGKSRPEIQLTLLLVWPLLFGMFMIMIGNGLQGTLLSLRAELDGFSLSIIGIVMSLYYCGYLAGCYIVPRWINTVGHIRVFAGLASLASTTILIQGIFVDPYVWSIFRFFSGICFVGLFIVSESWLNKIATNKLRGQILSAYIFVTYAGLFSGQFLINLAPIETIGLFVLISVLLSLSLLPITLADKPSPGIDEVEHLPIKKLIKTSPTAVFSVIISGFAGAVMLTIGPIYARNIGFTLPDISIFMGLYVLGCATVPLFTGWLSDRIERRKIITATAALAAISSMAGIFMPQYLLVIAFIFGGCSLSVYSISVAMMNDRLKPSQMTSATSSMIMLNGCGASIAPICVGALIEGLGESMFFLSFTITFSILTAIGLYRILTGPEFTVEEQGDHQTIPARPGTIFARIGEDD